VAMTGGDVSSDSNEDPRGVVVTRADTLDKEEWWKELLTIEGVEDDDARKCFSELVDEASEETDLLRLAQRYSEARAALDQYNHSAWEKAAWGAWPIFIVIGSVAAVLTKNVWAVLVSGSLGLVFPLAYESIKSHNRRSQGVENAPAELSQATTDLDRRVRSTLEESVRWATRPSFADPAEDVVTVGEGVHLSSRAMSKQRIATRSRAAIELHMLRTGGAAVGVTGERGMGKSELLRSFCWDESSRASVKEGGRIGVFLAVPAAFNGIDFLRLLARRLVEAVPDYKSPREKRHRARRMISPACMVIGLIAAIVGLIGLGGWDIGFAWDAELTWSTVALAGLCTFLVGYTAEFTRVVTRLASRRGNESNRGSVHLQRQRRAVIRDAADLLRRVRYTESLTAQAEGTVGWAKHGLTLTRGKTLSELPLSEADLIAEIAALTDELDRAGYRVVVGIDELDKLQTGDQAENFLNSVKQLFAIRSCSFLVSVSRSAWLQFVRRSLDVRNVIESSLDAIESLEPFAFLETRSLIRHRGESMTDAQVLFCHVLSGGMPRDALRCARELALESHRQHGGGPLAAVAPRVLEREVELVVEGLREQAEQFDPVPRQRAVVRLLWLREQWKRNPSWDEVTAPPELAGVQPLANADSSPLQDEVRELLFKAWLYIGFVHGVEALFVRPSANVFAETTDEHIPRLASELCEVRRMLESNLHGVSPRLMELGYLAPPLPVPGRWKVSADGQPGPQRSMESWAASTR
jgi:KAP family P-loop domain